MENVTTHLLFYAKLKAKTASSSLKGMGLNIIFQGFFGGLAFLTSLYYYRNGWQGTFIRHRTFEAMNSMKNLDKTL